MDQNQSGETMNGVGQDSDVEIRVGADYHREIWGEMRIVAAPATAFALPTDAQQMMNWLAQSVTADARPAGTFCLADLNGLWVGTYLEVVRDRKVVFTWGGIEGLSPGQSTVGLLCTTTATAPYFGSVISVSPIRRWKRIVLAGRYRGCRN